MTLATALGLTLLGLGLLAGGGEVLVRGSVSIARMAGLTPAVIGLTVVAMGTSLPELAVSILAAVDGRADLAVGNAVGSNIFNIAGTLALTAVIAPIPVTSSAVKWEWPFMFLVSCLLVVMAKDGELSRLEGAAMVVSLATFTGFMVRLARIEFGSQAVGAVPAGQPADSVLGSIFAVLAGVALLVLGGQALVSGSVVLARFAGMSERVIGLTVVAAGTGAPELAASLVAARRGRLDLALANLIGSNIFNILGILGCTALFHPLRISHSLLNSDMVWMLVLSFALFPVMRTGMKVSRSEGVLLLSIYAAYLFFLLG